MAAAAPAGYALAGAATAIGGAFLSSISVATDFEHQMSGVKAVLAPDEVNAFGQALTDLALKLGKDTVFSSAQAAGAIEELVKAGVDVQTVLDGGASAALSLAAATGISVVEAATFAGTALNTFHETADQLTHTVDTLAGVANASAAGMGDLQFAFQAVGPVAATLGLSLDDTAIALGAFADNGLRGSDAGTSLKTMLLNLEPNTKASTAAMQALGIVTADGTNQFFDATGKAKSMSEIFEILHVATAGLSDEQKVMALQTAFGTDAVRAASIAASEGSAGFDKLAASVGQISAADAAKTRLDNLSGSLNQLGGSFETVQITIGTYFLPYLRSIVDAATGVLNAFLSLDPQMQVLIVAAIGIAGALAGAAAAFILLGPVLASVGAGFGVIIAAVGAVAGPLLLLVAAGAALYAAWQSDFGGIQEVVHSALDALPGIFQNAQNAIQNLVNNAIPILGNLRNTFQPVFDAADQAVRNFFDSLSNVDWSGFIDALGNISDAIGGFIDGALATLQGAFGAFTDFLGSDTAASIGDFINGALNTLNGAISQAGAFWAETLQPAISYVIDTINNEATQAFSTFTDFISNSVAPAFLAFTGEAGQALIDFFQNQLPAALVEFARQAESLGPLLGAVAGFFGAINNLIGTIVNVGFQVLGDLLFQVIIPAFQSLSDTIAPGNTVIADTANLFASMGQNLGTIGETIQPVTDFFNNMAGAINAVADAINRIPDWFQSVIGGGTFNTVMMGPDQGAPDTGSGGSLGSLSPLVSIGTLIISSEQDAVAFLQLVAAAVLASARRVSVPTAGGNPVLG